MQRRRYLAMCGTAAAGLLAGCNQQGGQSSPGGGNGDGPAQFDNIIINAPQEAAIESEVTMTVSARNGGGETGTYTDRITATQGDTDFAQDISIEGVDPGQTGETEVNAPVNSAGEYRFELENAGAAATVTVTAQAVEPGQMVDVGNDLRLTFEDVTFREAVYYRYVADVGYTRDRFAGVEDGDHILGVFGATMENTGSQPTRILPERFKIDGGTVHASIDGIGIQAVQGLEGQSLLGSPIEGGETVEGWVLASVPREQVLNDGVGIGWSLQAGGGDQPDRVWSFPPRALPEFQLIDFNMPDTPENGRIEGTVTVRNAGQVDGLFTGLAEFNMEGRGWTPAAYPQGQIASAQTKSFTFTYAWPYTQETVWRVEPFVASENRRRIQGGSRRLSFGESTAAIDRSTMTIGNPRFRQSYLFTATTQGDDGTSQQVTRQRDAPNGRKFLFVDISVTAETAGTQTPSSDAFQALVGEESYGQYTGPRPTDPDVSFYQGMSDPDQGQETTAALVFTVPADADRARVQYREEFGTLTSDIVWG